MPHPTAISLEIDESTTELFTPTYSTGTKADFSNASEVRFAENKLLRATIRAAAQGNTGHRVDWLGIRPIPAVDSAGCCVDKDNIPANTFTITTLLRKESSSAQAKELVAMIRAFVLTDEFADTVKGQSFY